MDRCKIHSGLLRHRVAVERLTLTPDGIGGGESSWSVLYRPWAAIYPATGWEKMQAMQLESPITHTIYIRYREDITARDRIIHRGRAFNIRSIAVMDEEREFLEIKAEEGVAV